MDAQMNTPGMILAVAAFIAMAHPLMAEEGGRGWSDIITVYGVVDARAQFARLTPDQDGLDSETESDFYVFNAGLGAEAVLNDHISGNLFCLWEEELGHDHRCRGRENGCRNEMSCDRGHLILKEKNIKRQHCGGNRPHTCG